jgi:serine/threonine protein phosphatase PrpC
VKPALWDALGNAQDYKGCSTACILRLDLRAEQPRVNVYNLGDCACMVLRASEEARGSLAVAEMSEARMHSSGAPYQLGGLGWKTDLIEDGLTFDFDVESGDVVLAYSDGVSGNLPPDEIALLVGQCASKGAAAIAQTLVEAARKRRVVDDDVTVVALRLGEGSGPTEQLLTAEAPWEKVGLRILG